VGGLLTAASPAAARPAGPAFSQPCPGPQPLVKNAKWSKRRIAPGVSVSTGTANDLTVRGQPGAVQMHVLRVGLNQAGISFGPLERHLADRLPLSHLAANHGNLVAATNTGFFDFDTGAPHGPFFRSGTPYVLTRRPQPVIAFTTKHQPISTEAWLDGSATADGTSVPLMSLNSPVPPSGLSIYDAKWGGTASIPAYGRHDVVRRLQNGKVASGSLNGNDTPTTGRLLLATSQQTEKWLSGLPKGSPIKVTTGLETTTKQSLSQGYGVGKELVDPTGKMATGLSCNERDTQAARTAVGVSRNGRTLIILVVTDVEFCFGNCPKREIHGLDMKELSRVMRDLGAGWAWDWDGSGSSEMIARLPSTHKLTVLNYCSDGVERPMPLGFGVYFHPSKARSKSRKG